MGGGGIILFGGGEAQRISKENFKLHNPSIKSIFRITSLIYFRCIRNTHYCFIKYTTLRFLVFSFFIFQVLQMLLHFQYCMSNILINIFWGKGGNLVGQQYLTTCHAVCFRKFFIDQIAPTNFSVMKSRLWLPWSLCFVCTLAFLWRFFGNSRFKKSRIKFSNSRKLIININLY